MPCQWYKWDRNSKSVSRKNQWGLSQHDQQHIPGLYDEHVIFHTLLFLQFYLSLENSLCKDYITEKFWKILPYNVIPIVLNGVNMSSIAPPHSYIDISDFSNFHGLYTFWWLIPILQYFHCRICSICANSFKKSIIICLIFLVERLL